MRREEFVLRPVRAGRDRVEIGAGTLLWARVWVRDVARAVRLAAGTDAAEGVALNLGERRTLPIAGWVRAILDADAADAELIEDRRSPPSASSTRLPSCADPTHS